MVSYYTTMVVHDDSEVPEEIVVARKPVFEAKKFVIVKNHVRELLSNNENNDNMSVSAENLIHSSENETKKLTKKSTKKVKKKDFSSTSSEENDDDAHKSIEIEPSDLEELKTVYEKCKAVVAEIEKKYGHLLDITHKPGPSRDMKRALTGYEEDCHCTLNKKIVFDEDGKQSTIDMGAENHICPKKIKKSHSESKQSSNIQIEYYENEIILPDDLQELSHILRNPDLEITYRNKVVDKMRLLNQELTNELKFNKHSLIEKLKINPDEVLDFKGTNLSSLPGYS